VHVLVFIISCTVKRPFAKPYVQYANVGNSVDIYCYSNSSVAWYFYEKELANNSAIKIASHNHYSQLTIESVQDWNFGTYQCRGLEKSKYVYFMSESTLVKKSINTSVQYKLSM